METREDIAICIIRNGFLSNVTGNSNANIDNMRKFHNWIKYSLIHYATTISGKEKLLDLSVGRGGDINKWRSNDISYVLGIDIDKSSIFNSISKGNKFDGAIERLRNMRIKKPYVKFHVLSVLDPNVLNKLNYIDNGIKYNIVSCQFSFHYFTENNMTLNHTFNVISKKLINGGIFIATFSNGDYIKKNLKNGNIKFGSLQINKIESNSYSFMLDVENDLSGINYFEIINENKEYFAMVDIIINIARENDLEIVNTKDFYDWYIEYKLSPQFKELSFQEMLISFLNISIIMKKIN